VAPPAAPELGEVGLAVVKRLLEQRHPDPTMALTGILTGAYGALVGGDAATARRVLAEVLAPAFAMEQALLALQRAHAEAMERAATLTAMTPPTIDVDVAFDGARLDAWREALEASVAAQMELIERITAVQQPTLAAVSAPPGVERQPGR
jgi:hypothetical protein